MAGKTYSYSEQQIIAANQNVKERNYWLEKLSGELGKSTFPYDYHPQGASRGDPDNTNHSDSTGRVRFRLTGELFSNLMRISNHVDYALHMILAAAVVLLLDKYTFDSGKDIITGTSIYKQDRNMEFINTVLALRTRVDHNMTFKELLMQVRQTIIEANENQNYPVEVLCEQLHLKFSSSQPGFPLFDIAVLVENIHDKKYLQGINPNMTFLFTRSAGYIQGELEYNPRLYRQTTVQRITRHLINLLNPALKHVDARVSEIDILSEQERHQLLYDFNDNNADFYSDKTSCQFIETHAERTPGHIAVVFPGNGITYKELNERANQLARVLRNSGVQPDQPVGILMQRSPLMVESIAAVWKTGAAYIPIDPQYPAQRIKRILKDSGTNVLITQSPYVAAGWTKTYEGQVLGMDTRGAEITRKNKTNPDLRLDINRLAYIIYTSGSTGKPKGAMVEHIGMMNHIQAKINDLHLTGKTIVAQNATHTFDISVWQFFVALTLGGRTVIYPDEWVMNPGRFLDRLLKDRVTILEVVPSYLSIILDTLEKNQAQHVPLPLNYLLVTGEEVKPNLVGKWFEKYPGIKVVNAYGPTEASDDITHFIMDKVPEMERIPIGNPLQNLDIYIVNKNMKLCPPGVSGEICVSGVGVGRGYLNNPEMTAEKFCLRRPGGRFLKKLPPRTPRKNFLLFPPYSPYSPYSTIYRTGDLARWLPDGTIDFLGRIDHQVKIRGFRIECGEIENTLLGHEKINNAVVAIKEDKQENKYLAAYLVGKGEEKDIDSTEIREYLETLLPDYMIPAYFVQLDRFPLTSSGKIDKKALPEPGVSDSGTRYEAPRTRTETTLMGIWQEVLGVKTCGINDNFFKLGGDSIKGIRTLNKIQQTLGEILHVTMIFEAPTIKQLAAVLDGCREQKAASINAQQLAKFRQIIPPLPPLKTKTTIPKNPPAAFILSAPRTGSTLLRVILAGHSQVFAPPELELLLFNTLQDRKAELSGPFSHFSEGTLRAIMEINGCGPEEAKTIMEDFEAKNLTVREFYGKIQQQLRNKQLIDKTANYALSLQALKRIEDYFQSPRYIHLTRHPYAVIHSYIEAKLDQVFRYQHHFSLRELAELVWLTSEQNIREFLKEVPHTQRYVVKFEDLVQQPAVVVPGICEFLGIPFEEKMLQVYSSTDKKMTDGLYAESRMIGDVKFFHHSSINPDVANQWEQTHKGNDFLGDISLEMAQSLGYLTETTGAGYTKMKIEPAPGSDYYPLSYAQKRLWILDRFEQGQAAYNIPAAYIFEGELNREALEGAYESIIKRHEILRTTFIRVDGEPKQKVHDYDFLGFQFEYMDLRKEKYRNQQTETMVNQEASTPFALEHGPLLRAKLIHLEEKKYIFLFTMHHIIADGWSIGVLVKEMLSLYNAYKEGKDNPLSPLSLQYKDYAIWQNSENQKNALKQQRAYWKEQFAREIPLQELPYDYPRPGLQSFEGSSVTFEIGSKETSALKLLVSREETTIYMGLLTLYIIFLWKASNSESITVGTPVAGRHHPQLEPLIGMFVNTLVVVTEPDGEKPLNLFLKEVKNRTLKAFANQDYPYEELVEQAAAERDTSRNPLFDCMFVMQNIAIPPIDIPGIRLTPWQFKPGTSKFDLTLHGEETGDRLLCTLEYCTKLFKEDTIQRFVYYFKKILSAAVTKPAGKISGIEIISEQEKQQILFDFNNTAMPYPSTRAIIEPIEEQVKKTPDTIVLVSRAFGGEVSLTYKKLNESANRMARGLKERGVATDSIVALMVERSIEMMVGILGILKAGSAYLPIDPGYPRDRIRYMLEDSESPLLLVRTRYTAPVDFTGEVIDIETGMSHGNSQNLENMSSPENLVYMIYTSGSTGRPRGVAVQIKGFINLLRWYSEEFKIGARDSILLIAPISFDLAQKNLFSPFTCGGCLCLASPGLPDYHELSDYIAERQITIINCAPSVFYPLVEFNSASAFFKLKSLRRVILGGEPIQAEKLRSWIKSDNYHGEIINTYGPTECTDIASFYRVSPEMVRQRKSIPIGTSINNTKLFILDKNQDLLPVGFCGEICIGGIGLSRGYLNNPELTSERFLSISHKSYMSYMSYIYRTGDLARWLPDGTIDFLGRIDHQVKIRGLRIELGEIENQLLNHQKIKEVVVIARQGTAGANYLCAYFVAADAARVDAQDLNNYLSRTLPDYMIPGYFIRLEHLPLTPSGKVNRGALPEPRDREINGVKTITPPRDKLEEKLVEMWADALGKKTIGIDANFFRLGGHSLKAILLISKIHREFNVKVPLVEIFKHPFIRDWAQYIRNSQQTSSLSMQPVEKKDYYALSSSQKRLVVLQQMDETGIGYNILTVTILEGTVHMTRFKDIAGKLIHRHESLRTSFEILEEEPVQRIKNKVGFEIEYYDFSEVEVKVEEEEGTRGLAPLPIEPATGNWQLVTSAVKDFIRPFDLSRAPLLRVGLIKGNEHKHILMIDLHHIISDGLSMEIFLKDFMALYAGKQLPPLTLQYKDYARWQNKEREKENRLQQAAYWQKQFQDEIPVLQLPTDFARPKIQGFAGTRLDFEISKEEQQGLNNLALKTGTTLYMVLLAIYNTFLSKITSQEIIIVGTPVAGRRHAGLEHIIGMFINTLAVTHYPQPDKTFNQFLAEVKKNTLEAFENQDYPFEELVEAVAVNRDTSRNPLFDTLFVLQNIDFSAIEVPDLKLHPYDYDPHTSKFDLMLQAVEATENIRFTFEYSTRLFTGSTIQRFIGYFKTIVSRIIENPAIILSDLEIISEAEKIRILAEFNDTASVYPKDKFIHRLFEEEVEKNPDKVAVVYEGQIVTYRALNQEAKKLAVHLQHQGVNPDTLVGIMIKVSLEMIVGVLAILQSGGAYLPIDPDYPEERIKYMLADSSANVLLSTTNLSDKLKKLSIVNCRLLMVNEISPAHRRLNIPPKMASSHLHLSPAPITFLAYIIYTSGSTGRPKGVIVGHRNVVRLVKNTNYINFNKHDRILQTGALEFDASTFEIWGSLLNGITLYLLPKDKILDPTTLKETLLANGITTLWMTSPLFNQMVQNDPEIFAGLKNLLVGGDVLSPAHINQLMKGFPGLNIINGYGPTENTTFSTTFLIRQEYSKNIPIGSPIANSSAYIVDKNKKIQPIGIVGELWVGGDGVARGYLNNPELTADRFDHDLWDYQDGYHRSYQKKMPGKKYLPMQSCSHATMQLSPRHSPHYPITPLPHYPIYHTGDLARWLTDGNIEFLGRMDHQVKIRGFRIEPGEVENYLLRHDDIKEAMVLVKEDERGDKYLCGYIVSHRQVAVPELKEFLSSHLPDYMIPSYFIPLEKIPLTPNGKVDWRTLPEPGTAVSPDQYTAPRDTLEKKLAEIWAGVLGIEQDMIGIDSNFFQLGGHSIKAALLASRIHKELDVKISLTGLFTTPFIRGLAEYIKRAAEDQFKTIKPVEKKDYYACSPAQRRLYVLQQMDKEGIAYNIPSVLTLAGDVDKNRFENTFKQLIKRHESLRTSFELIESEPVQKMHPEVKFEIQYYDIKQVEVKVEVEEEEQTTDDRRHTTEGHHSFIRPFDLSQAPLLRVGSIDIEESRHLLLMDMHHIASDGTSHHILLEEFMSAYGGKELPPLRLRYKDYSEWQNSKKEQETIRLQEKYWEREFEGEIPGLNLPTDHARPATQSFAGSSVNFEIDPEDTHALRTYALKAGATLYMVLLSFYYIWLYKLSRQEDIVVGTPAANRRHSDLSGVVGVFINTLALRNYPKGEKSPAGFLEELKKRTLQAFENQGYPFEGLVERLTVNRDSGRNPLFDVMLVLQNIGNKELETSPLKLKPYPYENRQSKFDLTLTAVENGNKLYFTLTYSTALFNRKTIQRLIVYFKRIISQVPEGSIGKISRIDILPPEEKHQLLVDFNDTAAEYPKDKTIHELFAEQAARTPDHTALVGKEEGGKGRRVEGKKEEGPFGQEGTGGLAPLYITYKELNQKANQLAYRLIETGVEADTIVGIMMEPSVEMIIGILGILKSGGAYLPIDPGYPQERINYMLADSNVEVLVTTPKLQVKVKAEIEEGFIEIIDIFNLSSFSTLTSTSICQVSPTNLAYVIYTSGSSGKPKAVGINHQGVVNYISWAAKTYIKTNEKVNFPLYTSISFDLTVTSIYTPLVTGNAVVVVKGEANQSLIERIVNDNQVGVIKATPPHLKMIRSKKAAKISSIRRFIVGGEELTIRLAKDIYENFNGNIEIYNEYGPTETVVGSMIYQFDPGKDTGKTNTVPIGSPINNTQVYILDHFLQPVPIGVVHQVYISGAGTARGYLNKPELTAEKFAEQVIGAGDRCRWEYKTNKKLFRGVRGGGFLEKSPPGRRRQIIYKTGDLGRWLPDGRMEFWGRIDSQVKIRGYRIETREIENYLLEIETIKETVVIDAQDKSGEKYLCAYYVRTDTPASGKTPELKDYLANRLPGYMIPLHFVRIDRIPLTPNGKVDRRSLPEPGVIPGSQYSAPGNEIERKLVKIWQEVLALNTSQQPLIGIDDNFFKWGGHSLKATIMIARVREQLDVDIPLPEVFKHPTIRGLSGYIKHEEKKQYACIELVEKKEYYALSSAQKRLYFLQHMDEKSTGYNMPAVMVLAGDFQRKKLEDTFLELIRRHESLRTSFEIVKEEPIQRIHDQVEFEIEYFDIYRTQVEVKVEKKRSLVLEGTRGLAPLPIEPAARSPQPAAALINSFIRSFDLTRAPLLRVGLNKTNEHEHLLLVDIHHIISDGISRSLLLKEFTRLYAGKELPALKLRYKDYSGWLNSEKQIESLARQEAYWKKQFDGDLPVLELPIDYPRPLVQRFEGSSISFEIGKEETTALNTLALEQGTTIYMTLLAIFNMFLSKISNQEVIVTGTPTAGRRHADLHPIIGMFVNTLVLKSYPAGEKTFPGFLKETTGKALEIFENQDYPFEDLLEKIEIKRDTSRNPIFDVMFVMQNFDLDRAEIPGLTLRPYTYQSNTSKFDLMLTSMAENETLQLIFEYSTNLFKEETIHRFIRYFKKLTREVLQKTAVKLSELEFIAENEKRRILTEFNDTTTDYPADKSIHRLFQEEVEKKPDKVAVGYDDQMVTYRALNQEAKKLAIHLQHQGVKPDTPVGIMIKVSLEMIVGVLAILQSGGAYLPIDPGYPRERRDYMLKDSGAKILLTSREIANLSSPEAFNNSPKGAFSFGISPRQGGQLAYIIYTSGSTGRPKGVQVEHRNVVRLVKNTNYITFNEDDRILQTGVLEFDASTFEIWGSLLNGIILYLLPKEKILDPTTLKATLLENRITTMWMTSPLFNRMVQNDVEIFAGLRNLLVGGDVLSPAHINPVSKRFPHLNVINGYGPTENTTFSTTYLIKREYKENIPIGSPIANSTAYIVDKKGNLQPIGIVGELWVGGDGVARGYSNNPELTSEKFCLRRPGGALFEKTAPPGPPRKNFSLFPPDSPYSPIYKTGDLARWLPDGNIEFLGRTDRQIKIRGFRIEPGEVQQHLLSHDHIKEAVVLARKDERDKHMCAYIVSDSELSTSELRGFLASHLPDYMIPSDFIRLDNIPLTANGKVDWQALPRLNVQSPNHRYTAPGDEVERKLSEIWAKGLGKKSIGIHDNFFDCGGHSLNAIQILNTVKKTFGVEVSIRDLFLYPTAAGLANIIKKSELTHYLEIKKLPEKEFYELSYTQKRLWYMNKREPANPMFNIVEKITLDEPVEEKIVLRVMEQLIARHESLRTSFKEIAKEPVQVIEPTVPLNLETTDLSHLRESELERTRHRFVAEESFKTFKLTEAPLFRMQLIKYGNDRFDLLFNIHHIISDGWSIEILKQEFKQLYQAAKKGKQWHPEPLEIQYKDYAHWQNQLVAHDHRIKKAKTFWKKHLHGILPVLNLPYDGVRRHLKTRESSGYRFVIDEETTRGLRRLAGESNASLFMVLLAGFNVLLSRITGQGDILVAIPAAARQHRGLENIIGMFVNTLILRNKVDKDQTFLEFFHSLQTNTFDALEYQNYPLELIFGELKIKYPQISAFFNMTDVGTNSRESLKDLTCYHREKVQQSKFDIVCYLSEYKNGVQVWCHYFRELFMPGTIEGIMKLYAKILRNISDDSRKKIREITKSGKKKRFKRSLARR